MINLKRSNEYIPTYHFKMEGIHTLRDLLRKAYWLMKVNLKDAYLTVQTHIANWPYLQFSA